jgi:hypothetical protein
MPLIFISYRRDDTLTATGRLTEALEERFGADQVFRDLEEIEAGQDFRSVVGDRLRTARVALVVIGRWWTRVTDRAGRRRLDDPGDSVRVEIETALAQDLLVVPVLVEGASMPRPEELPASIAQLAYRNAHEISESRWRYDTERLNELLARNLDLEPLPPPPDTRLVRVTGLTALTSLVAHAPRDFVRLLYEPRRFLIERASGSARDLLRAWTFMLVSQPVAGLLILQEWPTRSGVVQFMLAPLLIVPLVTLIVSVPLYLAWRVAGAPRDYRRLLVILVYQGAFTSLVEAVVVLITLVAVDMVQPSAVSDLAGNATLEGARRFLEALEFNTEVMAYAVTILIDSLIVLALLVWLAVTWGAYRETFHLTRLRSLVAFATFVFCCLAPAALLVWLGSLLPNAVG